MNIDAALRLLPNRRDCLQAAAACFGASWLRSAGVAAASETSVEPPASPIQSCILLFHYGGPSQLETFDPKPDAPAEVRGEYASIATSAPGVFVGEHYPRMARLMDRVCLVRSVHHPMRNHNSAAAEMLTGRTPTGGDLELLADDATSYPTLGSAVGFGLGPRAHALPYVALPYTMFNVVQLPGQTPGILGRRHDRFQIQGDPGHPDFRVSTLDAPSGRGPGVLPARRSLLERLDQTPVGGSSADVRTYQQRALDLIGSESLRRSFEMSAESDPVRDRYGRHLLGQSLLLARRLVEEGVNFVSVFDGQHNGQEANWDSHTNIFPRHRQLIPPADQALSALLEDLESRGLLESTLVIALSEFGRTPRVNGSAGRDHWPDCYTVLLAGAGVRGGAVHGASDRIAAYPERDPVTPGDLAATVLWRFGIDPAREFEDPASRPFRLADGLPLTHLF
ncbi:MAG: DUF1501 domain-containing protein [Planctomyces sp.]|nr:DUF1501 domain-containing protein [Planctomyces sp.]